MNERMNECVLMRFVLVFHFAFRSIKIVVEVKTEDHNNNINNKKAARETCLPHVWASNGEAALHTAYNERNDIFMQR